VGKTLHIGVISCCKNWPLELPVVREQMKNYFFIFFSNTRMTTALQFKKTYQPYTLAVFEPGTFCYGGGSDDHYATPPGREYKYIQLRSLAHIQCITPSGA
jgi:hypothetical protein